MLEQARFRGESLEEGLAVVRLGRWRDGGRFAVEAIGFNRWLVNACRSEGMDIVVVDPAKLKLKALGKKTDRRDAYEIARRLGTVSAPFVFPTRSRATYSLAKVRNDAYVIAEGNPIVAGKLDCLATEDPHTGFVIEFKDGRARFVGNLRLLSITATAEGYEPVSSAVTPCPRHFWQQTGNACSAPSAVRVRNTPRPLSGQPSRPLTRAALISRPRSRSRRAEACCSAALAGSRSSMQAPSTSTCGKLVDPAGEQPSRSSAAG